MLREHSPPGLVYFVASPLNGLIKIGWTGRHPNKRLANLRQGCPVPIEPLALLPGTVARERELHARFAAIRSHGEWFRDTPELREFIRLEARPWVARPTDATSPSPAEFRPGSPSPADREALRMQQWAARYRVAVWVDGVWTDLTIEEWSRRKGVPIAEFWASHRRGGKLEILAYCDALRDAPRPKVRAAGHGLGPEDDEWDRIGPPSIGG